MSRSLGVITDVKQNGPLRIWVHGPRPTNEDAAALMNLWDEGNRRVHMAASPGGDRHVRIFEEMMKGFRQLGYVGARWDGTTPPDWYIPLGGDAFDVDIIQVIGRKVALN